MNQEPPHDLAFHSGLQDFEVEAIERVEDRRRGAIKLVHIVRSGGRHGCPGCGKRHLQGLFDEVEPIRFRDSSIGDRSTFLQVRAMRIACCGGTRVEPLPSVMPGVRMTRRFFERIASSSAILATRVPWPPICRERRESSTGSTSCSG